MSVVYLGQDEQGRLVAVKVIHRHYTQDGQFLQRFRHEVEAARRVPRHCTAPVLDAGFGERPYLVTEFVSGPTLEAEVDAGGPLGGWELKQLAIGMVAALTVIHRAGVVHWDLKPGNVLLSRFGPRVIGFGIARALDAAPLTYSSLLVGTPAFMAPEQASQQEVTAAVDVFAWGGLVAYAGTGRAPFGDEPVALLLYRVLYQAPGLAGIEDVGEPAASLQTGPGELARTS